MKKCISFLFMFGIACICRLMAQTGGCGTVVPAALITAEDTFSITYGSATESLPQLNRTFSISVWVIINPPTEITPEITETTITNAFATLNQYFSPIAMNFKICSPIQYVNNYQFANLSAGEGNNEKDLLIQYGSSNTINLYITLNLYNENGTDVKGYAYMPSSDKNSIFVTKSGMLGSSLAHQMGHFFGLYHTHEKVAFGPELAKDRTNCLTTGDRCCDTEADPNMDGLTTADCVYTGKLKDSNNDLYNPSPKNVMSYSSDACRCMFTKNQYLRIIHAAKTFRYSLR
jgi:hypothetical protein